MCIGASPLNVCSTNTALPWPHHPSTYKERVQNDVRERELQVEPLDRVGVKHSRRCTGKVGRYATARTLCTRRFEGVSEGGWHQREQQAELHL